ncbi:hypothetical protein [Streptomyces sp. NPDC059258]|uniref:hypothetical protein n=1 Tax=unclassified Streptomyces TaxID=2593676 RepID=UPI0036A9EF76
MANPGYGKRSAPGERPRTDRDFVHLLPRDAAVAAYIDRLADGSDISVKTLAKHLPYGQCALRPTVLRTLECGECKVPGPPEALLGGLCRPCRGPSPEPPVGPPGAVQPPGVRDRMNAVRAGLVPRSERTYR